MVTRKLLAIVAVVGLAAAGSGCTFIGLGIGSSIDARRAADAPAPAPVRGYGPPGLATRTVARRQGHGGAVTGTLVGLALDALVITGFILAIKNMDWGFQESWGNSD